MLQIQHISTGSKGNAYLLRDNGRSLLIEAGIQFKKIQQAIQFETSSLDGVLISHSHGDHVSGAYEVLKRGIPLYTSPQCAQEAELAGHSLNTVEGGEVRQIGGWKILFFDNHHDVRCYGFLILTPSGEKVLFSTDTYYVTYYFKGVTHYLLECNYDAATIESNFEQGKIHKSLYTRVHESHMSLESVVDFLKANDLSETKEIHLLHLSETNSNQERIYNTITKLTKKIVVIP